jgi:hypothetical protein
MDEVATEGDWRQVATQDAPIHSIRLGIDSLLNKLQLIPLTAGEVNQRQMCITFFFFVSI